MARVNFDPSMLTDERLEEMIELFAAEMFERPQN
jgi:hypothetical protein